MDYKLLIDRIKDGSIKNINLIYGDEKYLIDKAVDKLSQTIVTNMPELNLSVLNGEKLSLGELSAACDTVPFLSEKKLVLVKDFYLLKSASKAAAESEEGSSKDIGIEDYIELINNMADTTVLFFINHGSIDKRKKLVNEIKKLGDIYAFDRVDRDELAKWVKGLLSRAGKTIGIKELNYFTDNSGYLERNTEKTLYNIENEIHKLISFLENEKTVSLEHINLMLPKNNENDIFKMINACSEKNIGESIRVYNDLLLSDDSSLGILALLSRQIKNMIMTKEMAARHLDGKSISKELGIHEFTAKQCMRYSSSIDIRKLNAAFNKCIEAETNIKSGKMGEKLALEMLLVNLFE